MAGSEWAVCMAVIDKTFGFQKTCDKISYGQLVQATDLTRQAVIDAVKSLEARHILVVNHCRPINQILFNKHYDTWVVNRGRLVNRCRPPSKPQLTKTSKPQLTHKRKKETITKERYMITAIEIYDQYPRKADKNTTLRSICKLLKAGVTKKELVQAQDNYRAQIEEQQTPRDRTIQSNNFYGLAERWREFVNPEIGEDEKSLRDFREYQKEIRAEKGSPGGSTSKTTGPD